MSSNQDMSALIRLVLFSSEHCFGCKPLEQATREYLRSTGLEESVHLSVIDVDKDQEAKRKYDIIDLPAVMLNEKIIHYGYSDDLTDYYGTLMNSILNVMVESYDAFRKRKGGMINVSLNALRSASGEVLLRPSIGDYVHIGVLQTMMIALYSLDPLVPELQYQAGKESGKYGMSNYQVATLNPRIGITLTPKERFQEFLTGLELYYSSKTEVPFYNAEEANATIIEDEKKAVIRIRNLPTGAIHAELPIPMCDYTAGEIAGLAESFMTVPAICVETQCQAMGAEYCEFELRLVEQKDEEKRPLPKSENKEERNERREILHDYLSEIRLTLIDSILFKKRIRPVIGDFIHINLLQSRILGLILVDKFIGSVLYTAGSEMGVSGPGKDILFYYVKKKNIEKLPLDIDEAIEIVVQAMTHPTTYLTREYSIVEYEIDESDPDDPKFLIRIEENAVSSGIPPVGQSLCDYTAGYIAGRLQILTYENIYVKETKCIGLGDDHCEFEIFVE